MAIDRISDVMMQNASRRGMNELQGRLSSTQRQISTGIRFDTYTQSGKDSARIINLSDVVKRLEGYNKTHQTVKARINTQELVVRDLTEIASDYRARLVGAVNAGNTDNTFRTYCQNQLTRVQALLNTKDSDGRYIFGGGNTLTEPVDVSLIGTPALGGAVNTDYYLGTEETTDALVDKDLVLSYGMLASDEGIAKLIHCLKIGAGTTPSSATGTVEYQKLKDDALTMMNQVCQNLPDLLQDIGGNLKLVEETEAKHEKVSAFSQDILAEYTDTNIAEAYFKLNKDNLAWQFGILSNKQMEKNSDTLLSLLRV